MSTPTAIGIPEIVSKIKTGAIADALLDAERVLAGNADMLEATLIRGVCLRRLKRLDEAIAHYGQAILRWPQNIELINNFGNALLDAGRPSDAAATYAKAAELDPSNPVHHTNMGRSLHKAGQHAEAARAYEAASHLKPDDADIAHQCGYAWSAAKSQENALNWFKRAAELSPASARACNDAGVALHALGCNREALEWFTQAIRLKPDMPEACNNAAVIHRQSGEHEEAMQMFAKALAADPTYAAAHYNRGLSLLSRGFMQEGWQEYEWRWKLKTDPSNFSSRRPSLKIPVWCGEPLKGRSIVVHAEQGLGDSIQFCRYIEYIKRQASNVVLLMPASLHRLLGPVAEGTDLRGQNGKLDGVDYQIPLLSIPQYVGEATLRPPYLFAEPDRVSHWRKRIGTEGFKIGISWQGNPTAVVDRGRSISLDHYRPLIAPGIRLISLQKNHGLEQAGQFPALERFDEEMDKGEDAFIDTAAIMRCLDLVITCDTAVAHLAGALGVPLWIALSHVPDWRWLWQRPDSPDYPSARLFRQPTPGDWESVFETMRQRLAGMSR